MIETLEIHVPGQGLHAITTQVANAISRSGIDEGRSPDADKPYRELNGPVLATPIQRVCFCIFLNDNRRTVTTEPAKKNRPVTGAVRHVVR